MDCVQVCLSIPGRPPKSLGLVDYMNNMKLFSLRMAIIDELDGVPNEFIFVDSGRGMIDKKYEKSMKASDVLQGELVIIQEVTVNNNNHNNNNNNNNNNNLFDASDTDDHVVQTNNNNFFSNKPAKKSYGSYGLSPRIPSEDDELNELLKQQLEQDNMAAELGFNISNNQINKAPGNTFYESDDNISEEPSSVPSSSRFNNYSDDSLPSSARVPLPSTSRVNNGARVDYSAMASAYRSNNNEDENDSNNHSNSNSILSSSSSITSSSSKRKSVVFNEDKNEFDDDPNYVPDEPIIVQSSRLSKTSNNKNNNIKKKTTKKTPASARLSPTTSKDNIKSNQNTIVSVRNPPKAPTRKKRIKSPKTKTKKHINDVNTSPQPIMPIRKTVSSPPAMQLQKKSVPIRKKKKIKSPQKKGKKQVNNSINDDDDDDDEMKKLQELLHQNNEQLKELKQSVDDQNRIDETIEGTPRQFVGVGLYDNNNNNNNNNDDYNNNKNKNDDYNNINKEETKTHNDNNNEENKHQPVIMDKKRNMPIQPRRITYTAWQIRGSQAGDEFKDVLDVISGPKRMKRLKFKHVLSFQSLFSGIFHTDKSKAMQTPISDMKPQKKKRSFSLFNLFRKKSKDNNDDNNNEESANKIVSSRSEPIKLRSKDIDNTNNENNNIRPNKLVNKKSNHLEKMKHHYDTEDDDDNNNNNIVANKNITEISSSPVSDHSNNSSISSSNHYNTYSSTSSSPPLNVSNKKQIHQSENKYESKYAHYSDDDDDDTDSSDAGGEESYLDDGTPQHPTIVMMPNKILPSQNSTVKGGRLNLSWSTGMTVQSNGVDDDEEEGRPSARGTTNDTLQNTTLVRRKKKRRKKKKKKISSPLVTSQSENFTPRFRFGLDNSTNSKYSKKEQPRLPGKKLKKFEAATPRYLDYWAVREVEKVQKETGSSLAPQEIVNVLVDFTKRHRSVIGVKKKKKKKKKKNRVVKEPLDEEDRLTARDYPMIDVEDTPVKRKVSNGEMDADFGYEHEINDPDAIQDLINKTVKDVTRQYSPNNKHRV